MRNGTAVPIIDCKSTKVVEDSICQIDVQMSSVQYCIVCGRGRELLMNACVTAFITVIVTDILAASSELLVFVFFYDMECPFFVICNYHSFLYYLFVPS